MLKLNKVHHIALICSDYQRSLDFYTRVIGCQVIAEHWREEQQSYLTKLSLNGDYVIELFSFPSPPWPRATRVRTIRRRASNSASSCCASATATRRKGSFVAPPNESTTLVLPPTSPRLSRRWNLVRDSLGRGNA